ncbi:hypothetical protein GCM10017056_24830 [Seohaeicola zhoushanensis]|uniref:Transposase DDE domain-containing protein n=1 Tax=Seohaeicola zhoushanensis TaxID=1569283 RepID=A0A8J3M8D7_9RHOB|nr:hypothetical protein GCM10017056_24830 [Seohaeicola zhoushanensis]
MGRPLRFFMTAGQVSDYTGALALLRSLPEAEWLIADRGYDADWFREALKDKGIRPCIPGRKSRGKAIRYDKRKYKRRNRIEIMFGRLKDWRRVATRYDRCAKTFLSAIALAATVIFWLGRSMSLEPRSLSRSDGEPSVRSPAVGKFMRSATWRSSQLTSVKLEQTMLSRRFDVRALPSATCTCKTVLPKRYRPDLHLFQKALRDRGNPVGRATAAAPRRLARWPP